jgi:hypothetical protein
LLTKPPPSRKSRLLSVLNKNHSDKKRTIHQQSDIRQLMDRPQNKVSQTLDICSLTLLPV